MRTKLGAMNEQKASRTLLKSPPELWAECSDAQSLARHLGELGEIRIKKLEPEHTVAWEGDRASGTVKLEPSGWGTRVTLTYSTPHSEEMAPEGEVEPEQPQEPEPEHKHEPEPQQEPEPEHKPEPEPKHEPEPKPSRSRSRKPLPPPSSRLLGSTAAGCSGGYCGSSPPSEGRPSLSRPQRRRSNPRRNPWRPKRRLLDLPRRKRQRLP